MTIVLDATLGGASANSYITVDEADDLIPLVASSARATAWAPVAAQAKAVFLIRAVKMIETYMDFDGRRFNDYQPLDWPRYWVYGPDRLYARLVSEIPTQVKEAQALMALNLSEGFEQDDSGGAPVTRVQVSTLRVFFDVNQQARGSLLLPPEVVEKLRGFGEYVGASGQARSIDLVRA